MPYFLTAPDFTDSPLELRRAFVVGFRLFQNDVRAPKGTKRGTMVVTSDDGELTEARFVRRGLGFDVPDISIDRQTHSFVRPLSIGELTVSLLPLLLIVVGGAIGGLFGGVAAISNTIIFRTSIPDTAKWAIAIGLDWGAVALWLAVIAAIA